MDKITAKSGNMKIGCYEWVRLVATLLVVAGHSSSLSIALKEGYLNYFTNAATCAQDLLEFLRVIIYSFHMPLFVSLSGAVFALSYKKERKFGMWFLKRAKKLLLPYYLIAVILYIPMRLVVGYYGENVSITRILLHDVIFSFDINYLWYLVMLTEVTGIAVLFRRWIMSDDKRIQSIVFVVCLLISTMRYIMPTLPFQLNRTMEFLLWFYVGVLYEKRVRRVHIRHRGNAVVAWLFSLWIIFFALYTNLNSSGQNGGSNFLWIKVIKVPVRLLMEGSAILGIFGLFKDAAVLHRKVLRLIEEQSMNIYLFHVIVITLIRASIQKMIPPEYMTDVLYIMCSVLTCTAGVIIPAFIGRRERCFRRKRFEREIQQGE